MMDPTGELMWILGSQRRMEDSVRIPVTRNLSSDKMTIHPMPLLIIKRTP